MPNFFYAIFSIKNSPLAHLFHYHAIRLMQLSRWTISSWECSIKIIFIGKYIRCHFCQSEKLFSDENLIHVLFTGTSFLYCMITLYSKIRLKLNLRRMSCGILELICPLKNLKNTKIFCFQKISWITFIWYNNLL